MLSNSFPTVLALACATAAGDQSEPNQQALEISPAVDFRLTGFGVDVAVADQHALVGSLFREGDEFGLFGIAYLFDIETGEELATYEWTKDRSIGFGSAVALSSTTALIGAAIDSASTDFGGSAFLFDIESGSLRARIEPSEPVQFGQFGATLAISDQYALIGASSLGPRINPFLSTNSSATGVEPPPPHVYIFDAESGEQLFRLSPDELEGSRSIFGASVAIEGSTAVVGAPATVMGSAYVFNAETGELLHRFFPEEPLLGFGISAAISDSLIAIGAPILGDDKTSSVYVFDTNTGEQLQQLKTPDGESATRTFGFDVAISGTSVLVSNPQASGDGLVFVYDALTGEHTATLRPCFSPEESEQLFGFGLSVASNGTQTIVGRAQSSGSPNVVNSVFVFEHACFGDCDQNGRINFADLVSILFRFGEEEVCDNCDTDENREIDFDDVIGAVTRFGPCE